MYRHIYQGLFFVILLIAFCFYSILPLKKKVNLGLDLKGGTLLQYRLDLSEVQQNKVSSVVNEVKGNIYKRLDRFGLKEIEVRVVGRDNIQVAVPGVTGDEIKYIKQQISTAGKLTIRLVVDKWEEKIPTASDLEKINLEEQQYKSKMQKWNKAVVEKGEAAAGEPPRQPNSIAAVQYKKDKKTKEIIIDKKTKKPIVKRWWILHNEPQNILPGSFIERASSQFDSQTASQSVTFNLQGSGARKFEILTGNNLKKLLAIEVDGEVKSIATIKSVISQSGRITGDFTKGEADSLANILSVGSLPTKPELSQEQVIGSRLGQDSIHNGEVAVVVGFLLVVLFMLIYYMKAGIIADFALFFNLLLIMTYVVIFGQTLTFPGIAGVLLTVGMAVDANILIFERIREELKTGKGLVPAISTGYDRAFWTIFDANATTFITGLVLFKVGTGPIQGFAITLMAGLVANFLTSIYISRLLMSILHRLGLLNNLKMLEAFSTPNIPFIKNRHKFVALSGIVIITGLSFLFYRGKECIGIDFRGGIEIQVNLKNPMKIDEFKKQLVSSKKSKELFKMAQIQALETGQEGATGYLVRVPNNNTDTASAAPAAPTTPVAKTPVVPTTPAAPVAPAAKTPAAPAAKTPAAPAAKTPAAKINNNNLTAPGKKKTSTTKSDFRTILKNIFSQFLAPSAFPVFKEKDYINPDLKINILQVNLYKGEVPHKRLEELNVAGTLQKLITTYIENRNKQGAKSNIGMKTLGKFEIADVKLLKETNKAYATFEISTSPIKYGEANTPIGSEEVQTALKAFFQSDFYKRNLDSLYQENVKKNTAEGTLDKVFDFNQLLPSEQFPRVSMVDSAVAVEFQGSAMIAIMVSLLAIIFYIAIRFEFTFGIGAVTALIHDVLCGIGALAVADTLFGSFFSVKIDLPVIAAFLTIIGYSLNDTIVVFDRIRENMRKSKKWVLEEVVNNSINQTLSRTIWTSLTTFMVVLVLLLFGGETIQGFAFIMLVGVVVGTYSSIFIASPVMIYFRNRRDRKREEHIEAQQKSSKNK